MTFAGGCTALLTALPTLVEMAPWDQPMWHQLLQVKKVFGLVSLGAREGVRLAAPLPSLAIHTTEDISFYGPPKDTWGGGASFESWCGLAECLRDAARQHLSEHAPLALAALQQPPAGAAAQ